MKKGPESPPLSNLNLLMAAAISTAWSEVNNSEDKCETPKVSISLEKAIKMWKNIVNAGMNKNAVISFLFRGRNYWVGDLRGSSHTKSCFRPTRKCFEDN